MLTMEKRNSSVVAVDSLKIAGLAVPFNEPATVAGRKEIIYPEALAGISLDDITLTVNHDSERVPLARSPKTMILTVTERGLELEATLPDTAHGHEVYEAVKRGDMSEMSFAFDVAEDTTDGNTRIITKIAKIYEISIVNNAVYKKTFIETRSNSMNPITDKLTEKAVVDSHDTAEYRSAFYKKLMGKELSDAEIRAFDTARAEKRSDAFNTLSNSAAVIPTETLNQVIRQAHGLHGVFDEIRLFAVPNGISIPIGTPADRASWHEEGAVVDRNNITATAVSFAGHELMKVMSMSAAVKRMEISAFENYLTAELRASLTDALSYAVINGTGEGQPKGLLTGVDWDNTNSKTTDKLSPDDLLAVIAMLGNGYANGAKFAMSTATLFTHVYALKDGDGRYYFTDADKGGTRRLFGFEIVLDDNLPAGVILFGNFRFYGLNIPQGIAVEVSRESGFTSGLIDYRALCIADGRPITSKAFAKLSIANG